METETLKKLDFDLIIAEVNKRTIGDYSKVRLAELSVDTNLAVVQNKLTETTEARLIIDSGQHVPFMGLTQIKRLLDDISKGLNLTPNELVEVADYLRSNRMITKLFNKNQYQTPLLANYAQQLGDFLSIEELIYNRIKNGKIADDANSQLRKIRSQIIEVDKEIASKLNQFIRHKDNQAFLQEKLIIRKEAYYTVPIKAEYKNKVKGTIIETSNKGQTVFVEPTVIRKLNEKMSYLLTDQSLVEYQIIAEMTGLISEHELEIRQSLEAITMFDIIFARAKYSREIDGVTPKVNKHETIKIIQGRHPLLKGDIVPLDFDLGKDYRGLIITGPNAGGKTLVLKTVGLLTLMTMFGLQIPAAKETEIAVLDELLIDIGDQQNLENALSTFSGHMQNISQIVKRAKRHTLIALDEIGSGTDPKEGAALAIAIVEQLYQKGALVLATTHYGEVKDFAKQHPDFTPAAMRFDLATLTPKYQLDIGKTGDSQAFWIAEKMALPKELLQQATNYLTSNHYPNEKQIFPQTQQVTTTERFIPIKERFNKGDRVTLTDVDKSVLVYEDTGDAMVKLFIDHEIVEYHRKRVSLQQSADELYPDHYDLTQLFVDYQTRKFDHDINRGSKKVLKKLKQEQNKLD